MEGDVAVAIQKLNNVENKLYGKPILDLEPTNNKEYFDQLGRQNVDKQARKEMKIK